MTFNESNSRPAKLKRLGVIRTWLALALSAYVIGEIAVSASGWQTLRFLRRAVARDFSTREEVEQIANWVDTSTQVSAIVDIVALLSCFFFYAWFLVRAISNLIKAGTGYTGTGAGAIGWHFVPVANLYKPLAIMAEIWNRSHDPDQPKAKIPMVLLVWWISWVVGNITSMAAIALEMDSGVREGQLDNLDVFTTAQWLIVLDAVLVTVSAVCLFVVTSGIARAQAQILKAEPNPA